MEFNVATIVDYTYLSLLDGWLKGVKTFLKPKDIYVICADDNSWSYCEGADFTRIKGPNSHQLSISKMHHASGSKLFLFNLLPPSVTECIFLDVDIVALSPVAYCDFLPLHNELISLVPDYFVGYKEKMQSEFERFDPQFKVKFFPDGRYFYFNLGMFWASRPIQRIFDLIFKEWGDFIRETGSPPSILEQNIFNYHLMKNNIAVHELPISFNCLRSYRVSIRGGKIFYNTQLVSLFHLNGGKPQAKLAFLERLNAAIVKSFTTKNPVTRWR